MSVGEMPGDLNPYEASKYGAKERKELSMVFQFAHMNIVGCYLWNVIFSRLTIIRKMGLAGSGTHGVEDRNSDLATTHARCSWQADMVAATIFEADHFIRLEQHLF